MKRLLAWLGLWSLVWTEDYDGTVRLRVVTKTPFGRVTCGSIAFRDNVVLNPDGTTSGCTYVVRWKEWPHNLKHIVFDSTEGTKSDG